ncbi:hypothetical protein [Klebsiella pneumoniae]|uniref:hypothetical protein n=1 Tax=Klebsiella pneumoniae TaxID=573 RepID=UPI0013E9432E|nr:hypothetical protein [Klebsiella pneumoniae]NGX72692.1 hypothetical protein [Klebsiella pneumoniae]HBW9712714.1 hypothetical protein [Klebsiella pneumoniae]HBY0123466.1 hypothetical protein [Klebsiella pneumoniae]
MSILFNPELDSALNANGTESVKDIDAGLFQGVGQGVSTGFSNAGTSLQRIGLTTLGRGQMQVAAAQMQATANITGNEALSDAAQDVLSTPEPTEDQLPQYKSFDSDQVGAVGTILGGLVQQSPSLALMVVNPVAGVSVAGAQGYTEAHAEGARLGLTGEDLEDYSAVGGATMAVGAAIPGFTGVGKGAVLYGSRFLAGGVVNSATGELDRWGRAEILDSAGFHEQARQMRQADAASRVTEFVLGGAFGLLGGAHRTEIGRVNSPTSEPAAEGRISESPDVPEAISTVRDDAQAPLLNDHPPIEAYSQNLQDEAANLIPRGERKKLVSDIHQVQYAISKIDEQRQALRDQPVGNSSSRRIRNRELANLDQKRAGLAAELEQKTQALAPHIPGGRSYDAKAELSRLNQRLQEQRQLVSSIHEDAAIAHVLHDHYVTEAAPGLSTDARSEAGHVAAMDSAIDSINSGRGVDVTDRLTGDRTFIVRGDIDAGNVARQQLAGNASRRVDAVVQAADRQAIPEKVNVYPPGVLSDATNQPFQLLREQLDAVAETHPELRDLVAQHIDSFEAEHTTARRTAELYDVAAACALKFGS